MIDIENSLFSEVANVLRMKFPGIYVTGEESAVEARFPCCSFLEYDNADSERHMDSGPNHFGDIYYEVNAYSNKTSGKKAEAKAIVSAVAEVLTRYGFTMTSKTYMNMNEASVGRCVARFKATVDSNEVIYRR